MAEALAHRVPVLTTHATPWRDLERHDCGRCIDLARSDLAAEIATLAQCDLPHMGERGRAWVQRDFSMAAMVDAFEALYRDMVGQGFQEVAAGHH